MSTDLVTVFTETTKQGIENIALQESDGHRDATWRASTVENEMRSGSLREIGSPVRRSDSKPGAPKYGRVHDGSVSPLRLPRNANVRSLKAQSLLYPTRQKNVKNNAKQLLHSETQKTPQT